MRKYADLKEPLRRGDGTTVYRVMLCEAPEGVYLFEYDSPEAAVSAGDLLYGTTEELFEDWNGLLDERGWIGLPDPLPGCQQDAFLPLRIKGRDKGKPEWGRYELLQDGSWIPYRP